MNTFNAMTFSEPVLTGEEELRLCREIDAGVLAAEALAAGRAGVDERDDLETLRTWGEVARGRFVRANLKLVQMVTHPVAARTGVDLSLIHIYGAHPTAALADGREVLVVDPSRHIGESNRPPGPQ